MSPAKKIAFLSLTFFCLCGVQTESNVVKSIARWFDFDPKLFIMNFASEKTKLVFLLCENYDKSGANCSLRFEDTNQIFKNSTKICNLEIKPEKNFTLGPPDNVHLLTKEIAIIIYEQIHNSHQKEILTVMIVDLKKNCSSVSEKVPIRMIDMESGRNWFVSTINDSFEVTYRDNETCKNSCSIIFDNNGRKIRTSKGFKNNPQKSERLIVPTDINYDHGDTIGCFNMRSEEHYNSSLLYPGKHENFLESFPNNPSEFQISTAHGILSKCKKATKFPRSLNCTQGNKWVKLDFDHEPKNLLLHSLPSGGYLVLTSGLTEKNNTKSLQYFLTSFNMDGKRLAEVKFIELTCNPHVRVIFGNVFSSTKDNEYCVSLFDSMNTFYANCFSKHLLLG
ncbi:hypothetical protein QAD02_009901 [Eretmocerus hayati]|uniref:Uncharacterized protein n=1 Tax=Eretmocerus hayati TaxID=131215 RepID=A0ACC2NBW0_9HYME|nr:hypothetical protein QAD02_009901 [Eretmocerus hayati]